MKEHPIAVEKSPKLAARLVHKLHDFHNVAMQWFLGCSNMLQQLIHIQITIEKVN